MKEIRLIILIFFIPLLGIGQIDYKNLKDVIKPVVDERVELLGVVFRLAEAKEYTNSSLKNYMQIEDNYFFKYKKHELIDFTKKIRDENGIGYDAVMSLAINLKIENNNIFINKSIKRSNIDERWGKYLDEYIVLLRNFYSETSFHIFFTSNKNFHQKTADNFTAVINKVDFDWFEKYYGETSNEDFNLIIALNTNGGNYGVNVENENGKKSIFSIIGARRTDSLGIPVFNNDKIVLIIHEFSHSFCNPVIDSNYELLKDKATLIFEPVKDKMRRQAYSTPKTMLYEILVRASVIKYLQAHTDSVKLTPEKVNRFITKEYIKGFLWIKELVVLLDKYIEGDYKSLYEFAPEISVLQNSISIEEKINEIDNNSAKIISSTPANNDNNVDPNLTKIIIEFDKPMLFVNGSTYGEGGKQTFPDIIGADWNKETKKQWIIEVKLEPNKQYSIKFPNQWFSNETYGYPLKNTYVLNFKTRGE